MSLNTIPYVNLRQIGQGGFSRVYYGQCADTGQEVAIKVNTRPKDKSTLEHEYNVLKSLDICDGIPRVLAHSLEPNTRYQMLVFPYMGMCLKSAFSQRHNKFKSYEIKSIAIQLLTIIKGIHECGYLHCDLKPANILVGQNKMNLTQINLIDYGLSKI